MILTKYKKSKGLETPIVQGRLIQQVIAQVLSKIYEPLFSENSFGFCRHRGAKDAIIESKQYINQGSRGGVDMDLEKFFDKVNHDILIKYDNKTAVIDFKIGEIIDFFTSYGASGSVNIREVVR